MPAVCEGPLFFTEYRQEKTYFNKLLDMTNSGMAHAPTNPLLGGSRKAETKMEQCELCDRCGLVSDVLIRSSKVAWKDEFLIVEKRRNGWPAELKQDKCSPFISVISSSGAALIPEEYKESECQNHQSMETANSEKSKQSAGK